MMCLCTVFRSILGLGPLCNTVSAAAAADPGRPEEKLCYIGRGGVMAARRALPSEILVQIQTPQPIII